MAKIKPYLIRLTPTGSFFFGGERSLAGTGNDAYFVRSRHFPQQTSLLGLLRYQLLAAYGLLREPHKGDKIPAPKTPGTPTASQLIGAHGFQQDTDSAFGKVAGISPVLLAYGKAFYAPMLPSAHMTFSENPAGKVGSVFENNYHGFLPRLQGFDPKQMPDMLLFGTNGSTPIPMTDVFKEKTRIGITKNKKHFPWMYANEKAKPDPDAEMEGFFKQVSFSFAKKDWAFAFIAWIEEDAGLQLENFSAKNPLSTLGAERSMFHFDIQQSDDLPDFSPAFPALEKNLVRVVLLSDAWADPLRLYENCLFAHTETLDFRFLQSEVATTTNYYRRGDAKKANESLSRSLKYHLFKRGSVFFAKEEQVKALTNVLKDTSASKETTSFRRIGYNAFAEVRANIQSDFFNPDNQ